MAPGIGCADTDEAYDRCIGFLAAVYQPGRLVAPAPSWPRSCARRPRLRRVLLSRQGQPQASPRFLLMRLSSSTKSAGQSHTFTAAPDAVEARSGRALLWPGRSRLGRDPWTAAAPRCTPLFAAITPGAVGRARLLKVWLVRSRWSFGPRRYRYVPSLTQPFCRLCGDFCSAVFGCDALARQLTAQKHLIRHILQYDRLVIAFLASAGVTLVGAVFAACWHILTRNGDPEFEDLAVGFDLLVAAVVLEFGFLPGSHGLEVGFRWAGVGLLFLMLMGMAVATRFLGYDPVCIYASLGRPKLPVYRMTSKAVWVTSIVGAVVLCILWWLNVNIGLVVSAWKGVLP